MLCFGGLSGCTGSHDTKGSQHSGLEDVTLYLGVGTRQLLAVVGWWQASANNAAFTLLSQSEFLPDCAGQMTVEEGK